MSEADNTWRVTLDGRRHDIEVHHDTLTGKIVVTLDGSEVGEDRTVARPEAVDVFVGDHVAVVFVSHASSASALAASCTSTAATSSRGTAEQRLGPRPPCVDAPSTGGAASRSATVAAVSSEDLSRLGGRLTGRGDVLSLCDVPSDPGSPGTGRSTSSSR